VLRGFAPSWVEAKAQLLLIHLDLHKNLQCLEDQTFAKRIICKKKFQTQIEAEQLTTTQSQQPRCIRCSTLAVLGAEEGVFWVLGCSDLGAAWAGSWCRGLRDLAATPAFPSPPAKGFSEFSSDSHSAAHLLGAEESLLPCLLSQVLLLTPGCPSL